MSNYADSSIMLSSEEYHYNDTTSVSEELGFNLAFGITGYDGTSDFIEDPEIGEMKAYYRAWGSHDVQETYREEGIPTRLCTPEDFPSHQRDPDTGDIIPKTHLVG